MLQNRAIVNVKDIVRINSFLFYCGYYKSVFILGWTHTTDVRCLFGKVTIGQDIDGRADLNMTENVCYSIFC